LIDVQEKEIARKEKELQAQVQKPADAEKYRIQARAEAARFKTLTEAEGEADARRSIGIGEADAQKAKGMAEASVIEATGQAEAAAMTNKAAAWATYNEAAIVEILLEKLPEIAGAVASPLAKTKSIVVVNSGGEAGGGAGASKITRDVVDILAQVPPLVEALSGVDLKKLVRSLPQLRAEEPAEDIDVDGGELEEDGRRLDS